MWRILLFSVLCLEWTMGLGLCPDVLIECQNSYCPGRRNCNYDHSLRRSVCPAQCSSDPNRDPCTCLATYKGCHIRQNATDTVSRPTFRSILQTTYSCVNSSADNNCDYDVHVLSTHRGNGDIISWSTVLSTGDINVDISVNGEEHSNKSLVLVLLSHYPMNWILDVPTSVTIDKVLMSSYHVDVSGIVYPTGSVLSVEKVSNVLLPSLANGFDGYGNHTLQALKYLTKRFGSISSFTGTYEADRFTMNIGRSTQHPGCSTVQRLHPIPQSPSPVISAQCHPNVSQPGTCYINSFRPTCSGDGYCRCPNLQYRDECTCLVKFGSCAIEKTAHGDNSVGVPLYRGRTQITSSCMANDNCQNSVHVISMYEARSTGFSVRSGSVSVRVSVAGEDTKPLILVLTSYYPIRWSLSIPSGVVFDKVIVSSYYRYLSQTSVSYTSGRVLSVEKINCSRTVQCYADGYDGDTVEQLQYLSRRYGSVSSWSSAYRTNVWSLNIQRRAGCTSEPISTHGQNHSSSCPVIPFTSGTNPFTIRPPPSSSTSQPDSPFGPSLNSSLGTQARTVVLVSVIVPILVALPIIIIIVVFVTCHRRANRFSHNQTPASHPPPNQVFYTQQNSNLRYTRATYTTSPAEHITPYTQAVVDWTSKPDGTPQQVLTDSAPPAYHVALKFPQPPSKSEAPPPYPR